MNDCRDIVDVSRDERLVDQIDARHAVSVPMGM